MRYIFLGIALLLIPVAGFAQFNQVPIISTSMGGIVSGTYGYFKYISATNFTSPVSFSVNKGGINQTVSANVWTKLTWSTKEFDTNNNFASDKFTPTVPGKYIFNASAACLSVTGLCGVAIYKNGSYAGIQSSITSSSGNLYQNVSKILDMNGTTDYAEAWVYSATATTIDGNIYSSYFTGALLSPQGGASGGTATPAGSSYDVQYNSGGALAADTGKFTYASGLLSAPNISTTNISLSTINGTPVGSLGGVSKLASLTDVNVSGKVSGSVLVYNGATTSWTTLPIQNVMSTTTMVTNFPDAIKCHDANNSNGTWILYLANPGWTDGNYYYIVPYNGGSASGIAFTSAGTYIASSEWGGSKFTDCHASIPSLYSTGQAFNFLGNSGVSSGSGTGDRIVSGTTGLTAISNTNTISITTNNVVTGYFNSNGVLTVPGVSATSNLTSVTTLYASGNVGIGTINPDAPLDISKSQIWTTNTWNKSLKLSKSVSALQLGSGNGSWGIGGSGSLYFFTATDDSAAAILTYRMDLSNAGILTVRGTSTCVIGSGSGATNCTSDRRLKKDITPIQGALDKLMKINGVTFHWKDPKKSGPEHIGVIAQDVEKVFPQAVGTVSDTVLGTAKTVDMAALVAPMIEALKELKADNDNLRAEFEAYKRIHP